MSGEAWVSADVWGQPQVLACGCVGVCTCPDPADYATEQQSVASYGQPYQDAASGLWYAQDASGQQYLWSGSGWVGANSPEATQVMADHLSGLLTQQQLLPPTQPYTDPAGATAAGSSVTDSTDAAAQALIATGDPAAIDLAMNMTETQGEIARMWLHGPAANDGWNETYTAPDYGEINSMSTTDPNYAEWNSGSDYDLDGTRNPGDVEPFDAGVQTSGDVDTSGL